MVMGRTITALKVQKRDPNRVNVYLDGEFTFGLARIVAAWLKIGQELSEEKIASLLKDDNFEVMMQKAYHYLSYRPRTEKEVRQNLITRGYGEDQVDHVIDTLKDKGLINDKQFAQAWVENRSLHRPRGHKALAMELHQKGVARDVINEVVENSNNEYELALIAARKYAQRLKQEDWKIFREKLGAYLGRRGFSYETISDAVRQVWNDNQSSNENIT